MTIMEQVVDNWKRSIRDMLYQNELMISGKMRPGHREITISGIVDVDDTKSVIEQNTVKIQLLAKFLASVQ